VDGERDQQPLEAEAKLPVSPRLQPVDYGAGGAPTTVARTSVPWGLTRTHQETASDQVDPFAHPDQAEPRHPSRLPEPSTLEYPVRCR